MNDKVISKINDLIVIIQAIINDLQGKNDFHLVCEDTIEKLEEFKSYIQETEEDKEDEDEDTTHEKC